VKCIFALILVLIILKHPKYTIRKNCVDMCARCGGGTTKICLSKKGALSKKRLGNTALQTRIADQRWALDWTWIGSGLCQILLNVDWIRSANCFINLGSGPDLDWVNGKELRNICYQKAIFCLIFGLYLDLDF